MTAPRSLPARPSQEFLRKQAKRLAREIADGNAVAIARARVQLRDIELPLSLRDAQLVIAREYGYAGWSDLTAEVLQRLGEGLEWAGVQAERAIHDNDLERLKQWVAGYPALLSWGLEHGGLVGRAVHSYAMDVSDPERERTFTRRECAEFLIDAGAVVVSWLAENMLNARSLGMLQLFAAKGLLPRALKYSVALGDEVEVRARVGDESGEWVRLGNESEARPRPGSESEARARPSSESEGRVRLGDDSAVRARMVGQRDALAQASADTPADPLGEAFLTACAFQRESLAALLLARLIELSPELAKQLNDAGGRAAFLEYMYRYRVWQPVGATPWRAFLMHRVMQAMNEGDLAEFTRLLRSDASLIGESNLGFEVELIEHAIGVDRPEFIERIFELDPALLLRDPRPRSNVFAAAFTAGKARFVPLLTRVWALPDDLPSAAGVGDLANVKKWFDASGAPALGDPTHHFPGHRPRAGAELHWSPPTVQRALDTAFAHAVMNGHFEIADFLLQHGADINTRWSSHEPASILHELVFHDNYPAMQFLIDHGIDMTLTDYRWGGTAQGWAYHAATNEKMAKWLADAEERRANAGSVS